MDTEDQVKEGHVRRCISMCGSSVTEERFAGLLILAKLDPKSILASKELAGDLWKSLQAQNFLARLLVSSADGDTSSRNLAMHILSIYTMHGEILSASQSFLTKVLPTLLEMIVEEKDTFATDSISLIDAILQSQNAKAIYSCVALGVPTLMKYVVKQRSGRNKLVEELLLKLLRSQRSSQGELVPTFALPPVDTIAFIDVGIDQFLLPTSESKTIYLEMLYLLLNILPEEQWVETGLSERQKQFREICRAALTSKSPTAVYRDMALSIAQIVSNFLGWSWTIEGPKAEFSQILLRIVSVEVQVVLAEVLREVELPSTNKTPREPSWHSFRSSKLAICVSHLRSATDFLAMQGEIADNPSELELPTESLKAMFEMVERGIGHLFDFLESLEPKDISDNQPHELLLEATLAGIRMWLYEGGSIDEADYGRIASAKLLDLFEAIITRHPTLGSIVFSVLLESEEARMKSFDSIEQLIKIALLWLAKTNPATIDFSDATSTETQSVSLVMESIAQALSIPTLTDETSPSHIIPMDIEELAQKIIQMPQFSLNHFLQFFPVYTRQAATIDDEMTRHELKQTVLSTGYIVLALMRHGRSKFTTTQMLETIRAVSDPLAEPNLLKASAINIERAVLEDLAEFSTTLNVPLPNAINERLSTMMKKD